MIVIEEINTITGKKRYKVVSEPKPIDFNPHGVPVISTAISTELSTGLRNSWRTRRGAERALKHYNKQNAWKKHE